MNSLFRPKVYILLFLAPIWLMGQDKEITFHQHIAPIIHNKCTPCHRPGEAAPFNLITYKDVVKKGKFIKHVTETRYMPPWKADIEFRKFYNQKVLSQEEIDLIGGWVGGGMVEGETTDVQFDLKVAAFSKVTRQPDLVLTMNNPFTIPGDNSDQFRIFIMPTHLQEDVYVSGIEFVPGNKQLVHHARIMIDTTQLLRIDDGLEVGDSSAMENYRVTLYDYFWYGYVPGNLPIFFPQGTARQLPKNSDLIVNLHYSPTPVPEVDQSTIKIYFSKSPVKRLVKTYILEENRITNQPFLIPPDTVITFYMRSPVMGKDISLISLLPHMHLLGTQFKAFAVTAAGDIEPLIKIDNWDFNWQMSYQFERMLKIPSGSVIYVQATYDNTTDNPANPFDPPRLITNGWGTYQEMMNFIMEYVDYQEGDEKISFFTTNPSN